jgi:hypothetical protein
MKYLNVSIIIIAFAALLVLPAQTHWQGPYQAHATIAKVRAQITASATTQATANARDGYYMCSTWVKGKPGKPDSDYFAQGPESGSSTKHGRGRNKRNCYADATTYGYDIGKQNHFYDSHSDPP